MKKISEVSQKALEKEVETEVLTLKPVVKNLKPILRGVPTEFADKGFKNFDVSDNYSSFKAKCIDYSKNRLEKNGIVFFGKVGTGKTHLAIAIMRNLLPIERLRIIRTSIDKEHHMEQKRVKMLDNPYACFLVADEFFQELNDIARNYQSKSDYIKSILRNNDLVVLDDLSIFNWSPAKQENLYMLINRAYLDHKKLIITTNFTPDELQAKDERITSRLKQMSYFLYFQGRDYRERFTNE